MEQVTLDPSKVVGNLSGRQSDLISEDLATFLIAHHILVSGNDSIASIKKYFSRFPEIFELVDELLFRLEESSLIQVSGDKIVVSNRFVDIGGNVENLQKFLPRLLELSSERVLNDAELGVVKGKKEAVRYFAIPDDAETSAEAQSIYLEFKAKMLNLVAKSERENRKGKSVRFVGYVNCELMPEDFV